MGIDAEMFVRAKREVSDDEIKVIAWDMCAVFGADNFWDFSGPLSRIDIYEQDGPNIEPEQGEVFLRVRPATRYYGKRPPRCARCVEGRGPYQCGWGSYGQYGLFRCSGCGKSFVTRDKGKTWGEGRNSDEAEEAFKKAAAA